MKKSWRHFFGRVATTCLVTVTGSWAWNVAVDYAVAAYDDASDPVYNDGWQEGDIGGTGFTAWNFDGSYASTVQQRMDDGLGSGVIGSSTFNDIGEAWSLYNPVVAGAQRDIARAGRGFAPLQVGQTLSVVIDNPTDRQFFRGYFVRLSGSTGGVEGNICYSGTPCTAGRAPKEKLRFQMFEYFTYGEWKITHGGMPNNIASGLFDRDDAMLGQIGTDSGVRFEVKLTDAETFEAKMIPLDNPGATFTHTGSLNNPGFSIDWIEFPMFNRQSSLGTNNDFFIRSIEITDGGIAGDFDDDGDVDGRDFLEWQRGNSPNGTPGGPVSAADLATWQGAYGAPLFAQGTAVPEPTCISLLVFAAGGLSFRCSRPGKQVD